MATNPFNTYGGGGALQGPGKPPKQTIFDLIQQWAGAGGMGQGAMDPMSPFPIVGPIGGYDEPMGGLDAAQGGGGLNTLDALNAAGGGAGGAGNQDAGINEAMQQAAAKAAQGFWPSVNLILGHAGWDAAKLARLTQYYQAMPTNRWREPKEAKDMLLFAHFLDDIGETDDAEAMVKQILSLGFRAKAASLTSMFAPLMQQWGLSYNQPAAKPAASNNANNANLQQLIAMLGGA